MLKNNFKNKVAGYNFKFIFIEKKIRIKKLEFDRTHTKKR